MALFTKNFASMCRGLESCLINQIPKIYKAYRKKLLADKTDLYDTELLDAIIKRDNNKHLHPDEQNLLLGFMNNLFFSIHKRSRNRFNELKSKYVVQYKDSVRPVIGIDEATDYSLLDYYLMVSFRHYEFSSITLCGDIMQGLNSNGIEHWSDLQDFILPNLDVKSLNVSYRQLPTLVEMSKEMYKDDQGQYPSYNSDYEKSDEEPKPLLFVSDDENEKAYWISKRIVDIIQTYETLPSVAIFVGDEVNIPEFIERIEELDMLNGVEIVDCSGGKKLDSKEVVRVFRLSEVKGMEFEAVFFYDIDKAIEGHSAKIMRRHLYVGVSRATSHLAATMSSADGNESIIKYFDTESDSWM
jgi:superfamily I DNA/RNA helicase